MLSIATDVRATAVAAAGRARLVSQPPREFRFHDVAYGSVSSLVSHGNLAIFIDPIPDDPAHANLVIPQLPAPDVSPVPTNKKQTHQIYREISELLRICSAEDLRPLKALRRQ
jgi:hypothetical protein